MIRSLNSLPPALDRRLRTLIAPGYISTWLATPVPALDGRTPLEVNADGDDERLARLLSRLRDFSVS